MRDALLRRSEAAAVLWKHIATEPDGSGRLTIPWSKTDQQGVGVVLYLGPPTMKALDKIRPRQPLMPQGNEGEQEVFGLKAATISERIAAAARAAGLGEGYSGHSCRVGMAVDLAEAGRHHGPAPGSGPLEVIANGGPVRRGTVRRPQRRRPAVCPQAQEESLMGYPDLCHQIGRCLRQGPRSVPQLADELGVDPTRIRYAIQRWLVGIYVTPAWRDNAGRVTEWGLMRPWPW